MVLDCSGRSGTIAVARRLRTHVPGGRMQALVGVWERPGGWFLQDPTHTFIETCDERLGLVDTDSDSVRHVGMMVDVRPAGSPAAPLSKPPTARNSRSRRASTASCAARSSRGSSPAMRRSTRPLSTPADPSPWSVMPVHVEPAVVIRREEGAGLGVACGGRHAYLPDPSRARRAGAGLLLPLGLTGLAAEPAASREFAIEALDRHRSRFWSTQASAVVDESQIPLDELGVVTSAEVRAGLARLREADTVVFSRRHDPTFVSAPIVRGHGSAIEDAVMRRARAARRRQVHSWHHLVALATRAPSLRQSLSSTSSTAAALGAVPLPDFLRMSRLFREACCTPRCGMQSART